MYDGVKEMKPYSIPIVGKCSFLWMKRELAAVDETDLYLVSGPVSTFFAGRKVLAGCWGSAGMKHSPAKRS